jgi:hypothetical protein
VLVNGTRPDASRGSDFGILKLVRFENLKISAPIVKNILFEEVSGTRIVYENYLAWCLRKTLNKETRSVM